MREVRTTEIAAIAAVVLVTIAIIWVQVRRRARSCICERTSRIFVSIASYRDELCRSTVESMYRNATYPSRVYAGIYEQNADESQSESCAPTEGSVASKFAKNIRTVTVNAAKASGPCTARYQCGLLMRDEPVFVQIDSHSEFASGWDVHAIQMLRSTGAQSGSVVISTYPVNCSSTWENTDPPVIDKAKYASGWMTFQATLRADARRSFVPSRQIGGGLLLCMSSVIRAVPIDPGLAGTFNGEELLYTARLYTHGIDVVAPTMNIVCHRYTYAEHKTVWTDRPEWRDGTVGHARMDALLSGKHHDMYGPYGMGRKRTLHDFWKYIGIDYDAKTVGEWAY